MTARATCVQALAAAMVAFAFLYFRRLYTIRPDAVYRKALIQLNTNPGILEVRPLPAVHRLQYGYWRGAHPPDQALDAQVVRSGCVRVACR